MVKTALIRRHLIKHWTWCSRRAWTHLNRCWKVRLLRATAVAVWATGRHATSSVITVPCTFTRGHIGIHSARHEQLRLVEINPRRYLITCLRKKNITLVDHTFNQNYLLLLHTHLTSIPRIVLLSPEMRLYIHHLTVIVRIRYTFNV